MTMDGYVKSSWEDVRKIVKAKNIGEEDMLEQLCKDNPQSTRSKMEEFVQRIYHPSASDLEEEKLLGL